MDLDQSSDMTLFYFAIQKNRFKKGAAVHDQPKTSKTYYNRIGITENNPHLAPSNHPLTILVLIWDFFGQDRSEHLKNSHLKNTPSLNHPVTNGFHLETISTQHKGCLRINSEPSVSLRTITRWTPYLVGVFYLFFIASCWKYLLCSHFL